MKNGLNKVMSTVSSMFLFIGILSGQYFKAYGNEELPKLNKYEIFKDQNEIRKSLSLTHREISDFFINLKEFINSAVKGDKIPEPLIEFEFEDSPFLYHMGHYCMPDQEINVDIYIRRYTFLLDHIKILWFQAHKEKNTYASHLLQTLKGEISKFLNSFHKLSPLVNENTFVSYDEDCYATAEYKTWFRINKELSNLSNE